MVRFLQFRILIGANTNGDIPRSQCSRTRWNQCYRLQIGNNLQSKALFLTIIFYPHSSIVIRVLHCRIYGVITVKQIHYYFYLSVLWLIGFIFIILLIFGGGFGNNRERGTTIITANLSSVSILYIMATSPCSLDLLNPHFI